MKIFFNNIKFNLYLIFLFCLILRVLFLIYTNELTKPFIEDSLDYFTTAKHFKYNSLLEWKFHERPPLISFIIIPIIKIFNDSNSIIFIKLLMILLSVLTSIGTYFLAVEITKDTNRALVIALIYSAYPLSIFFSNRLLTENLSALLICLIALFFIKFIKKFHLKFLLIASFLMGLLTLSRSNYYYLPFCISIFIWFIDKKKTKKFFYTTILILTYFLTLSPWIIKNYNQFDTFLPTNTRLGYGLFLSNNDFSSKEIKRGGYYKSNKFIHEVKESKSLSPTKQSEHLTKLSLKEIMDNKKAFVKASVFRVLNFFNPKPNPYTNLKFTDFFMIFFYTPILFYYFFFLVNIFKKGCSIDIVILLSFIFYNLITYIPFYGLPRFRFPTDFLIFIIALNFFLEQIKNKNFFKYFNSQ
jgi:hypothetical protein